MSRAFLFPANEKDFVKMAVNQSCKNRFSFQEFFSMKDKFC